MYNRLGLIVAGLEQIQVKFLKRCCIGRKEELFFSFSVFFVRKG